MYKINYQTGEKMGLYDFPGFTGSLTKPAVDEKGNIYLGTVGPGNPIKILDPDLEEIGDAIEAKSGTYNRGIAVTKDGKDMYTGSTWNGLGICHFHSDDPELFPFETVDTLGNFMVDETEYPFWAEDVTMSPDGKLYAANSETEYSNTIFGGRYFVFDLATGDTLYSLGIANGDKNNGGTWNGRGCAWSLDGSKMYMADFGYNSVTVWSKATAIDTEQPHILSTFELLQNYPNPFNPVTTIPYSFAQKGLVELNVYSTTGELVTTLVNEEKSADSYEYKFNASTLASGVYIYQLKVDNNVLSKRMILVK